MRVSTAILGFVLFVLFALLAENEPARAAAPEETLQIAIKCSDAALGEIASRTCDPTHQVADMAVRECQSTWNALDDAVRASSNAGPAEASAARAKVPKRYSENMREEYARVAELKAIDIRAAADTCGFE